MSDDRTNNEDKKDNDKKPYERICYMCHRPESQVDKMITIPNNIILCSDCMQKTFDQIGVQGFPNMPQFPGMDMMGMAGMGMDVPEEYQERHRI